MYQSLFSVIKIINLENTEYEYLIDSINILIIYSNFKEKTRKKKKIKLNLINKRNRYFIFK